VAPEACVTFARYLSAILAMRVIIAFCGLAALLQILDLLENANLIFQAGDGVIGVATYALWRLPLIAKQVLPLAVLAGALVTFMTLARNNELIMMRAAGVTAYRIFASMLPVTAIIAGFHFILVDSIAPAAENGFATWWESVERRAGETKSEPKAPTFMRAGDGTIISVGATGQDPASMANVAFFILDDKGLLLRQLEARVARRENDGWRLYDVHDAQVHDAQVSDQGLFVSDLAEMPWPERISATSVLAALQPAESVSTKRLLELLGGEVPATEPASHYRTELLHNLALPLTAPLMVLLAMPATYGSSRHGGAARGFLLSFALGLGYLVSDKLFIAMGQAGLLPALLAAWGATVMFASIGIAVLLKFEEP